MIPTSFAPVARGSLQTKKKGTFIDLFCGIGGFHTAALSFGMEGVFASDIDVECRAAYAHNYGLVPSGDITGVSEDSIPDHDLLCAGREFGGTFGTASSGNAHRNRIPSIHMATPRIAVHYSQKG